MTSRYEAELGTAGTDFGPLPDPGTPAGEALAWWVERVRQQAYAGLKDDLPSAAATRVLRDRDLIADTPGAWAFAIRGPHTPAPVALRRNAWNLVAAALARYAPAAIDRVSAVRLAIGEEAIAHSTSVRHGASESRHELALMDGYAVVLRPDTTMARTASANLGPDITTITLGNTPDVSLPVIGAASLLSSLTLGDLRDEFDTIVVWLRTLVVGRAALDRAVARDPRPVLLKRMGDLARDGGNVRLANTIDEVVAAHSRAQISRTVTGVGRQFVVPRYVSSQPAATSPWLERHRVRMERALESVSALLTSREARLPRLDATTIFAIARDAKADDTYHSTTIEGYQITREEVRAVIDGTTYQGRTLEETERLMALKGYAQAYDWTLSRIRVAAPPVERPMLTEAFILDLCLELWSPSIDANVIDSPTLRDWRNHAVQIQGSDHVPPAWEKLRGLMTQYVTLLNDASVGPLTRAVVAHWAFVHLHPFQDGNGRIARLLMNYLLSVAGLPWTTIRAEERSRYFAALERAHVHEDLGAFAQFIADGVERGQQR